MNKNVILGLESAVAGGSLSLMHRRMIGGWTGNSDISRAEDLLPALDALLKDSGVMRTELSMIAVSGGPGSFTGIRIGLATALGLARGLAIPMSSVSVLKAMAAHITGEKVIAAVPMGRRSICVQTFARHETKMTAVDEPKTIAEDNFAQFVESANMPVAVHHSIVEHADAADACIDLGSNLSFLVAKFCSTSEIVIEEPVFVSKSF